MSLPCADEVSYLCQIAIDNIDDALGDELIDGSQGGNTVEAILPVGEHQGVDLLDEMLIDWLGGLQVVEEGDQRLRWLLIHDRY